LQENRRAAAGIAVTASGGAAGRSRSNTAAGDVPQALMRCGRELLPSRGRSDRSGAEHVCQGSTQTGGWRPCDARSMEQRRRGSSQPTRGEQKQPTRKKSMQAQRAAVGKDKKWQNQSQPIEDRAIHLRPKTIDARSCDRMKKMGFQKIHPFLTICGNLPRLIDQ
jgi:hypothetical protein